MKNELFVGIEIGGTKLQIVSGNANGQVLSSHRFEVITAEGATGIQNRIEAVIQESYKGRIAAVGIGFGGPVNRITGQIATSFHVEGWSGFPIKDWLEVISGCPVAVDNDANVAALGEATFGAGKGLNPVLYVTLGSGVGAGLIIDDQIYHGITPGELEIGHLKMDKSGAIFESRCSGWAVDGKIREVISMQPAGKLAKLAAGQHRGEAVVLKAAMDANDPAAIDIFNETMDDLAFGLSHAIHLLHPEVVVLGGGLSLIGQELRNAVAEKLPSYLMKAFVPPPVITLSSLKEQAVPVGSIILASQLFNQR
ncbi:MAG: ROK family protein [Chitinophagaceae bacterium]|nr:MAG: ROK family protein [Chitinophagaceae bacterium]